MYSAFVLRKKLLKNDARGTYHRYKETRIIFLRTNNSHKTFQITTMIAEMENKKLVCPKKGHAKLRYVIIIISRKVSNNQTQQNNIPRSSRFIFTED